MVLAKLCATESPTIFATGRKDSGNRLIGIPYRLAMIGQWGRLFTQLTTFRTMTCFGESKLIGGVGYNTSVPSDPLMNVCMAQPPAGETNPLSARFCTVANNVGDSVALNLAFNTSTSAHAAALLRLLACQRRLRPAPDPRLPWASRSQAHRSLHTRRRQTLRGALALSPGVFTLNAIKLLPFWSVGHF